MRITGLGDSCSTSLSPSNCAAAGGTYDGDNEVCVCAPVVTPTPVSVTATTPPASTGTCATNPCTFMDDIWASQSCIDWYAQCNPTSPFYIAVTKGALTAVGTAAGQAVGQVGGGLFAGLSATTGIPTVAWYAGIALLAYALMKK